MAGLDWLTQANWVSYSWLLLDMPTAQLILISSLLCVTMILFYWRQLAFAFFTLALLCTTLSSGHLVESLKGQNDKQTLPSMTVQMFDVGQGLSILVQSQKQSLIYDLGDAWQGGSQFRSQIAPFLMRNGEANTHQKDLSLVLSHHDKDHIGGLLDFLSLWSPDHVISPEPHNLAQVQAPNLSTCTTEVNTFPLGDAQVSIMSLQTESTFGVISNKQRNDRSCIMIVSLNEHAFVVMGDISSKAEKQWLTEFLEQLKALKEQQVVLVLSHHGSRHSSSTEFLQAISPHHAINSAGFLNRFKHPHPDVRFRLHELGIPLMNTADSGQIQLLFRAGSPLEVTSLRQQQKNWLWRTQTN